LNGSGGLLYRLEKPTFLNRHFYDIFTAPLTLIRKHVVNALKKAGLTNLETFTNGQEALDRLTAIVSGETDDQLPDLLITDIEMPKMDGLTLCRKIIKSPELADLRVIVFSSLINKQMVVKCDNVGADGYVAKPQLNNLIELIDKGGNLRG
jgi:two-component system chemotaxis response regulator CheV